MADKLAREMSHKQGAANQSARDNPLTGSALQALARGWAAGTVGMPGDIEGVGRMGISLLGGDVDKAPALPTTEFFKEWLPGKQIGDDAVGTVGSLFGGGGVGTLSRLTKPRYAEGGAVHWDSAPDANLQPQARGDEFIQVDPAEVERKRLAAEAQAAHTARNTMSREDFLKLYGPTFRADDKGGNAASEVAGQDTAAYYDRYLAPGAKGDLRTTRGAGDNLETGVTDYTMPSFGYKYRDANPNFDAWDNVKPHPTSQDLGGVGEFWRQIGRPIATGAVMYAGVGALNGALGGAGAAATGGNAATGLAGQLGMSKGAMATALNTGALNTGVGLVRGQDLGQALKGGVTSAFLSPVSGFVSDSVGGGVLGKLAGSTAAGGLQGIATGRGLTDGLQQGLVSGIASAAGDYVGGQTGSQFAGKATNALTRSTLSGKRPGSTIDALATQYAAGEIADLSGLDPAMARVVVNLARSKKASPVGALSRGL